MLTRLYTFCPVAFFFMSSISLLSVVWLVFRPIVASMFPASPRLETADISALSAYSGYSLAIIVDAGRPFILALHNMRVVADRLDTMGAPIVEPRIPPDSEYKKEIREMPTSLVRTSVFSSIQRRPRRLQPLPTRL